MPELVITQMSGIEDDNSDENVKILPLQNVGHLESISFRDTDDIHLVFNKKIVRIQIR